MAKLTTRECRSFLHTGEKLSLVPWLLNKEGQLEPRSFCDYRYLEQAFNGDQAFFLKTIGAQNTAEMHYKLEEAPYKKVTDEEMLKVADETCQSWFNASPSEISVERKARVVSYLFHSRKTTIAQLARIMQMPRDQLARLLGKKP